MNIAIRRYDSKDFEQLEQIVQTLFADDHDMQNHARFGKQNDEKQHVTTVVATHEDSIIGFASFYQNALHYHPNDFRSVILVLPDFSGQGIEDDLHQQLVKFLPVPIARLRTITPLSSQTPVDIEYLETIGYQPLLQSFYVKLDVNTVNTKKYSSIFKNLVNSGYRFQTLEQLTFTKHHPEISSQLSALCLEAYADTHTHSPPYLSQDWSSVFLNENCIDDAFFIALKKDTIVGFSSLQHDGKQNEMESMWDGVARSERALALPIRIALKLQEIQYTKNNNIDHIAWEVDSVDLAGMRLLKALPFVVCSVYQIWVYDHCMTL